MIKKITTKKYHHESFSDDSMAAYLTQDYFEDQNESRERFEDNSRKLIKKSPRIKKIRQRS